MLVTLCATLHSVGQCLCLSMALPRVRLSCPGLWLIQLFHHPSVSPCCFPFPLFVFCHESAYYKVPMSLRISNHLYQIIVFFSQSYDSAQTPTIHEGQVQHGLGRAGDGATNIVSAYAQNFSGLLWDFVWLRTCACKMGNKQGHISDSVWLRTFCQPKQLFQPPPTKKTISEVH